MVRLPARVRTWGKHGHGPLEDRVVVLGRFEVNDIPRGIDKVTEQRQLFREHCSSLLLLGLSQSFRDLGARRRLGAQSAVLRRVRRYVFSPQLATVARDISSDEGSLASCLILVPLLTFL